MTWTLENSYHLIAGIGVLIATTINVILFLRSRPDRLKAKIGEALRPLEQRMDRSEADMKRLELEQKETAERQDEALERAEGESQTRDSKLQELVSLQHRDLHNQMSQVIVGLGEIRTQISHGVQRRDVDTLHHRVTEVAKNTAKIEGTVASHTTSLENIENYLRDKP